jgi:hypothetical protein
MMSDKLFGCEIDKNNVITVKLTSPTKTHIALEPQEITTLISCSYRVRGRPIQISIQLPSQQFPHANLHILYLWGQAIQIQCSR